MEEAAGLTFSIDADGEHGWPGIAERVRQFLRRRVVRLSVCDFDGDGYCHIRIAGAYHDVYIDGELTKLKRLLPRVLLDE